MAGERRASQGREATEGPSPRRGSAGAGGGEAVEVFAPARADLAGGTLDLWPLFCFHPGSVTVNTALGEGVLLRLRRVVGSKDLHLRGGGEPPTRLGRSAVREHLAAAVVFALAPAGGVEVEVLEQLPLGSGLGGSSVLAVALARACLAAVGRRLPPRQLVGLLKDVEAQVLGAPTGCQDYYPAVLGGTLAVQLVPGGERVARLPRRQGWVARHLTVIFTGVPHHSGLVNWEVYRRRVDGDGAVAAGLEAIAAAARKCSAAILAADAGGVGRAIAADWQARRLLAPGVATPEVEKVLSAAAAAGALAGKACGAGGGGSVLLWSLPERREEVAAAALAAAGPGARRIATAPRPPSVRRLAALA